MPELPEVEVLKRSLEPVLIGQRFSSVEVRFPSLREPIPKRELKESIVDRRVIGLRRRAKYLLIDVEGDHALVVHLGMSGRLVVESAAAPPEPHEHLVFGIDDGRQLRFRDPRRFGVVFVVARDDEGCDRHFKHLGVEPLESEFDGALLARLAKGRRAPVKTFLMDARLVVGVGNIYACEALFRAGIHPNRSVARIASKRFDALAESVRHVLSSAIREGGTTLNDFANGAGEPGYFQVSLDVYGRQGEPCHACGATVRRSVHSGRSTFYCPRCQK